MKQLTKEEASAVRGWGGVDDWYDDGGWGGDVGDDLGGSNLEPDLDGSDLAAAAKSTPLPPGCVVYQPEGAPPGQLMQCPGGQILLTPDRQSQVDNGQINVPGVMYDLGQITIGAAGSFVADGLAIFGLLGTMLYGIEPKPKG